MPQIANGHGGKCAGLRDQNRHGGAIGGIMTIGGRLSIGGGVETGGGAFGLISPGSITNVVGGASNLGAGRLFWTRSTAGTQRSSNSSTRRGEERFTVIPRSRRRFVEKKGAFNSETRDGLRRPAPHVDQGTRQSRCEIEGGNPVVSIAKRVVRESDVQV